MFHSGDFWKAQHDNEVVLDISILDISILEYLLGSVERIVRKCRALAVGVISLKSGHSSVD
jgi:hypothetical protein